jgi:two-component system response regulator HupR/HoxA
MSVESSILFIADTCMQHKATADALVRGSDYRVIMAAHDAEATDVLNDAHVDLILADVENRDCDIVQFLARLRFTHPDLVRVLLIGDEANIKLSDALARTAAYQYPTKPLQAEQTCLVVKRALETRELARRHRHLVRELKIGEDSHFLHGRPDTPMKGEASHFERLVYASEAMSELCGLAREAARTDLPILIEGETGTGKELLARALHFHSRRSSSPLMVQNCGGMRDELLHSELFGHKRGSFTGAISDRLGCSGPPTAGRSFSTKFPRSRRRFRSAFCGFCKKAR